MRIPFRILARLGQVGAIALLAAAWLPGQMLGEAAGIRFEENRGQWAASARYLCEAGGVDTWLLDDGWVMQRETNAGSGGGSGVAVRMEFEGSSSRPHGRRPDPRAGLRHYFLGNDPRRWVTGVRSFARLHYPSLYEGIDLIVRDGGEVVEYDLAVAPFADPGRVVVRVTGHDSLSIDADGSLVVGTALGEIRQQPPLTWSEDPVGRRCTLPCEFVLLGPDRFGFAVAGWNGIDALVIDPGLVWSSYLGGSQDDVVRQVRTMANGEVVAAGETLSNNFPTTVGAYQATNAYADVFVIRMANDGSGIVFSTLYGGAGVESVGGLHVDQNGAVYVGGTTQSPNIPVTPDAFSLQIRGNHDAFIARFDAAGSVLGYATYFGGPGGDSLVGLHVDDPTGRIFCAGTAGGPVPTTAGATQPFRGISDAFVAVLDPQTQPGQTLLAYGTHYGGNSNASEEAAAMHVDGNGVVTIAGTTPATDLPTTVGAVQTAPARSWIARIDPSQSGPAGLVYGSYLGGAGLGIVTIAGVHATDQGVITVAGTTSYAWPTTASAFQPQHAGQTDGFVTVIDTAQSGPAAIGYSTLYGDQGSETVTAVHRSPDGIIAIGGRDNFFGIHTTVGALQRRKVWARNDGFVALIDPSSTGAASLVYGSYFSLCHGPAVLAIERDANGVLTLGGEVNPGELPTTPGAFQPTFGGRRGDGFVARLDPTPLPPSSVAYGASCAGSLGTPQLVPPQHVSLCRPFNIRATGLPPNQFGIVNIGFQNTVAGVIPLPFSLAALGAPGCTAVAPNDFVFFQPTGNGTSTMVINVPGQIWLVGARIYYQYLFVDPQANPLGIVATNGVETVIGY